MSRQAYPEYKPSSVKWLGDVPEHWDTHECKFGFSIKLGKMLQNEPQTINDEQVPYLKALHVQWESIDMSDFPEMWASPEDIRKYSIRNGDLLVCEGGEVGRAGILQYPPVKCIIQNALHRVRPKGANCNRFLMYLLEVASYRGWINMICNKATIAHFTCEKFGWLSIALPPPHEQRTIVAFLDRETARIDTLIGKKQRKIELLQEKRAAVISHAVTKGLDPNVKMKDSGIEWLGEIPEHWEVVRIKYVSSINDEILSEMTYPNYEILYIDIGSVDAAFGVQKKELMRFEEAPSRARRKVSHGDAIVSTVRTYLRAIAPIIEPEDNLIVSTGFAVVRPRQRFNSGFAAYTLRAPYFVDAVVARSVGVSYPAINASEIGNLFVAIPPSSEQHNIADFLDRETERIDTLIEKVRKSINLLREYRAAIISAAVTGKIDVRKEVA